MAVWFVYFVVLLDSGRCLLQQSTNHSTGSCAVSLPSTANPQCLNQRTKDLQQSKTTYQLSSSPFGWFPVLKMTSSELTKHYQHDQLNADWMKLYKGTIIRNLRLGQAFLVKHFGQEFTSVDEYKGLFEYFVNSQTLGLPQPDHKYFRFQFQDKQTPFKQIINLCKWREDKFFTDQRLAGTNPMSIQQLSKGGAVGVDWRTFHKKLNYTFHWKATILEAIGDSHLHFDRALNDGYVYVLHYLEYDGIATKSEPRLPSGRTLMNAVSPIVIFVSHQHYYGPNKLVPVAIQLGHTQDSPVYTPDEPDSWLLAKQTVQAVDFAYGQTVEHLLKTHLFMEPICVSIHRHLHHLHPLHQVMKYHCRGVFGANKFGLPYLVNPNNGTFEKLFVVGNRGAVSMIDRAFHKITWDMTDFNKNIKDRGMDKYDKVPYYPYRDDGKLIYDEINNLAREYIDLYYGSDYDVQQDNELQDFSHEVYNSSKIKGFPSSIEYKCQLKDILTRLMWMTSAQHSAVNYPGSYYAAFAPNMPCKLYNDPRVTPGDFDTLNFPGMYSATIQATITMTLTALHYDNLFDYGKDLPDANARTVFNNHCTRLNGFIKNKIQERNRQRYKDGDLPYPYLVPDWIANSIHT